MKTIISLGLVILGSGIFTFYIVFAVQEPITKIVKVQTKTTPTPCPSPTEISNRITPCNPRNSPSPEEIESRSKRAKEWEETKKRVLKTDFPLKSETLIDVDGDGKKDKIVYQIKPWKEDFEGLLKISSAQGKVIWEHEFFMGSNDLAKFLVEVLGYSSVSDWVNSVFNGKGNYAFLAEKIKIKSSEIDSEQLDYAAKLYNFSARNVKKEILFQKKNQIFSYRAEWREDLMMLVYVPSLKRFVCYSRGY